MKIALIILTFVVCIYAISENMSRTNRSSGCSIATAIITGAYIAANTFLVFKW